MRWVWLSFVHGRARGVKLKQHMATVKSFTCGQRACVRCTDEPKFSREYRAAVGMVSQGLKPGEAMHAPTVIHQNQRFVKDLSGVFDNVLRFRGRAPAHQTILFEDFCLALDDMGFLKTVVGVRDVGTLFMFHSFGGEMNSEQWVEAVTELLDQWHPHMDPCLGHKLWLRGGCCDFVGDRYPAHRNPEKGGAGHRAPVDPSGECRYPGFAHIDGRTCSIQRELESQRELEDQRELAAQ